MKRLFTLLPFLLLSYISFSQSTGWTNGNSNGDWNDALNWTNGVPDLTKDVLLPDPADFITVSGSAFAKSISGSSFLNAIRITIASGGELTVDGSTNDGIFHVGEIRIEGTLNVKNTGAEGMYNCDIEVDVGGTLNIGPGIGEAGIRTGNNGDILLNNGIINIDDCKYGIRGYTDPIINNATMNVSNCSPYGIWLQQLLLFENKSGAQINLSSNNIGFGIDKSDLENEGEILISNCTTGFSVFDATNVGRGILNKSVAKIESNNTATIFNIGGGEILNNQGLISAQIGTSWIKTSNGGFLNSGTLQGNGNINEMLVNTGIIKPGLSPGVIQISQSSVHAFDPASTLEMEIQDLSGPSTGHDIITTSSGLSTLDGTIDVSFIGGFTPSIGDMFKLVECSVGCTGTFSTANLPALPPSMQWKEHYNPNDYTIEIEPFVLPVDLLNFTGWSRENGNLIRWSTASEINTEFHVLEKSPDGFNWNEITRVEISENSNVVKEYEFLDQNLQSLAYYRLRTLDYDGYEEIFDPISIRRQSKTKGFEIHSLTPNPASSNVRINMLAQKEELILVSLLSSDGKRSSVQRVSLAAGQNNFDFDLTDVSNGLYFLVVSSNKETVFEKLLVQKL